MYTALAREGFEMKRPMATRLADQDMDYRNGWNREPEPVAVKVLVFIGGLVVFPVIMAVSMAGWWLGW